MTILYILIAIIIINILMVQMKKFGFFISSNTLVVNAVGDLFTIASWEPFIWYPIVAIYIGVARGFFRLASDLGHNKGE